MLALALLLAVGTEALPLPPVQLEDVRRFGPACYLSCRGVVDETEATIAHLERQLTLECVPERRAEVLPHLEQLHRRRRAWELLAYALGEVWSDDYHLICLDELRDLLGPERYYRGQMP